VSDRRDQVRSIRRLVGSQAWEGAYSRLGLSPDWIDPIFGLTDLERLAIWIYTTPRDWHRIVNDALWRGIASHTVRVFADILDQALRKLPRVSGTVYRGTTTRLKPEVFLQSHGIGEMLIWPEFTSATRRRRNAYVGNVLFRIESVSGRSLQGYGADESDEEVLFGTGTRYKVRDVVLGVDGIIAADLIELP
jgi:NAD:arginine ADP-ribosyltransferase